MRTPIRRVAIVGAGPTGVACAKFLQAEQCFETIDIFEQRTTVGGVWNHSGNERSRHIRMPQTNPRYGADSTSDSLEFESPLYDYLETNVPKASMPFSDLPFDNHLPLFPNHRDVLRYLEEYAKPVHHLIRFGTQAIDVRLVTTGSTSPLYQTWKVTTKQLDSEATSTGEYDAIVIANGHYTIPHVPEIKGIAAYSERYPNTIIHSKAYRRPEDFRGRKVLVIGNSASGADIASQLAPFAHHPIFMSARSANRFTTGLSAPAWRCDVSEIEEFLLSGYDKSVRTKSGQIIENLDAVIFATGYFYSYPFLKIHPVDTPCSISPSPSISSASSSSRRSPVSSCNGHPTAINDTVSITGKGYVWNTDGLTTSAGLRTHNMYKHFLHIETPTLAIPVLNLKVIPFPLAENQAAVISRIWSGRLDLPSRDEMRQWEYDEEQRLLKDDRLKAVPTTSSTEGISTDHRQDLIDATYEAGFHTLSYPEDVRQINTLYRWGA